jgi:hypothetical protein
MTASVSASLRRASVVEPLVRATSSPGPAIPGSNRNRPSASRRHRRRLPSLRSCDAGLRAFRPGFENRYLHVRLESVRAVRISSTFWRVLASWPTVFGLLEPNQLP